MRKIITALFLILLFIASPVIAEGKFYTCPMHTHITSDHSSTCPICGMNLVAVDIEDDEDIAEATPSGEKKILYWVAPMDPNYKMDKSGKSPMGMDLVPVYADGVDSGNTTNRASIKISPEMAQNIGVRTEKAQMASFGALVRSYGDVTENMRLQSDISGRVSGWINRLEVKVVGDEVKEGDLLFRLDSPELISAQQDYLSAVKTGVSGRINAAKRRLTSLGMQEKAINAVRSKRRAETYVPFYAQQNGIVSKINIREGSHVKSGMSIIQIQDYSSIWVDVSIAEQDIPYIDSTTKVRVSFLNLGIKELEAKIDYIHPTIDRVTRTGRVRLVLDNHDNKLKPGSYADVVFETDVKPRLSVPSDAILKSKDGDYVVIAKANNRFQPHKIMTGLRNKGRTEIIGGLNENDLIVVSGQFLIDSESSLRESFRKMVPVKKPSGDDNAK